MSITPIGLYGLEVPAGSVLIPAMQDDTFPNAGYHITMAALDPTEAPEADEEGNIPSIPRSTLRLVRQKYPDLDGENELDDDTLEKLLAGADESSDEDEDDDDDDDDEPNGGPSDPAKSRKAKQAAALKKLIESATADDDSDEDMDDVDGKPNGISKTLKKGKEPATESDDDDEDSLDSSDLELEEFVVCTLDTERNFQQPLDITIGPHEKVFFFVKGTHTIHLTGNYVIDTSDDHDSDEDDEDDDDDDFPDALEELYGQGDDSEEDELDDLEDPRIVNVDTDDDEEEEEELKKEKQPKAKGKNKRPAEEEADGLDALIAQASAAETKASKKQQKKLKNNKGEAVEVKGDKAADAAKETATKADKKVQFAKNLEQGPTGSTATPEKTATTGVKVVQGVTIDDRKVGKGPQAKKGNKVGMRYIGKLENGKVFDANKKGTPFSFKIGKGEVIKGWDIGIAGMSVGGERRLTIPASLAYGSKSLPGIPANSTLIFDVKLLSIN